MFFVIGLPRSRTSWMATFLTHKQTFCYHEAINGCRTKEEFWEKMNKPGYDNVGDSDSGLLFIEDEDLKGKKVIIHRHVPDVVMSLNDMGFTEMYEEMEFFADKLHSYSGLHVDFDDIDERASEIYEYLTGQAPDEDYVQMMIRTRIQPDMSKYHIDQTALKELMGE